MRRLALFVILLAVAVAAPASAVAADVPVLAGETVLSGSQTGYVEVRLPATIVPDMRPMDNDFVALESSGMAGVVLVKEDAGPTPPTFAAFRDGEPPCTGCEANDFLSLSMVHGDATGLPNFEAGTYRLYLVTDGKPASVRLTLPGQSGTLQLTPQVPTRSQIVPLPRLGPGTDNAQAFGATRNLDSRGLLAVYEGWTVGPHVLTEAEMCIVDGDPGSDVTTYAPGCSQNPDLRYRGVAWQIVAPSAEGGPLSEMYAQDRPAGPFGLGGNLVIGAPVVSAAATGIWLDYDA